MSEIIDQKEEKQERPSFLTTLCILSFIGGGYGFVMALYEMMKGGATEEDLEQLELAREQMEEVGSPAMSGFLDSSIEMSEKMAAHNFEISLFGAIFSAMSILGVFFMYKQQKKGFYLYTAANLLAVVPGLVLLGGNMMVMATYGGITLISLVFIGMYAANLKHMS